MIGRWSNLTPELSKNVLRMPSRLAQQKLKTTDLQKITQLGGGFKHFLFSPLFGEDSHFD